MSTIILDIPRDWWLTSNGRYHWAARAKRTRWIRQAAKLAARDTQRHRQAHITAYVAYPRQNKADPGNAYPTLKAAIDGVIDAGILPDDDHKHLPALTIRRDPPTGRAGVYRIRLVLTHEGA